MADLAVGTEVFDECCTSTNSTFVAKCAKTVESYNKRIPSAKGKYPVEWAVYGSSKALFTYSYRLHILSASLNTRSRLQSLGSSEKQALTMLCNSCMTRWRIGLSKPRRLFMSLLIRSSSSSSNSNDPSTFNTIAQDRLGHVMQIYEDFVGLTEVKEAQNKVVSAEQKFLQVQEDRRSMQAQLLAVQADVRAVSAELEKTSRTDSRYIDLVKREHEVLLVERDMSTKIKALDKAERDFFALLSAALRESHEKERARAEKTKYWSIIGSVIGAIIGIVGSTINNMRRMRELRAIVTESGENTAEYKDLAVKALQSISDQQSKMQEYMNFLSDGGKVADVDPGTINAAPNVFINRNELSENTHTIVEELEKHSAGLSSKLQEILKVVAVGRAAEDGDNVVYAGPEMESLILTSEEKLQNSMRKISVLSTVAISSVVTVGLGIMILILRGS
ncbi:coiled-coil domain-containing protein 51 [Plakobranchus ocellatus]|uniref:Coiled-coil domain-containing protein 51 n=1 Tax=Plakobranchus ocellatus TaxID=259542 RepID=A0AAV4AWH8_9GAST|nr:coiled-coil domain-containing protein 51 [Plakobranchus ocellatus]